MNGTRNDKDRYDDPIYQLPRLRAASTPMTLRTRDRKAIVKFCTAFADFLSSYYNVGLRSKHWANSIERLEDPSHTLYTKMLSTTLPHCSNSIALRSTRVLKKNTCWTQRILCTEDCYSCVIEIAMGEFCSNIGGRCKEYLSIENTTSGRSCDPPPFEHAPLLQRFFY